MEKSTTFRWSPTPMDTLSIGMTMETSVLVVRPNVTTPTYWSVHADVVGLLRILCDQGTTWPRRNDEWHIVQAIAVDAVEAEALIKTSTKILCLPIVSARSVSIGPRFSSEATTCPLTSR